MANQTDRFDLQTFDDGETNWDHTDTVEALDELAIGRGPIAARPATGSYDDELYLATDQRILWRWDANAADWKAASGLGSESQPVPGTSHFEALEAASAETDNLNVGFQNGFKTFTSNYDSLQDALDSPGPRGIVIHDDPEERFINETVNMDPGLTLKGRCKFRSQTNVESLTMDIRCELWNISPDTNIVAEGSYSTIHNCDDGTIVVDANFVGVYNCGGVDITFESGTSGGCAVGNRDASITDNGDNNILGNT